MYHSQWVSRGSKGSDENIEHLRSLFSQLIAKDKDRVSVRALSAERASNLQRQNRDLAERLQSLKRQKAQLSRLLNVEKQENKILKKTLANQDVSKPVLFSKPQPNHPITSTQSKIIHTLSPDRKIEPLELSRPLQSSPFKLVSFSETSANNRDQLYRLNSYLIENNTNIKLLIEKYNYLLKLRNLNFESNIEEVKAINLTNQILSNRKPIQQAKSILATSRKQYFGSESSSDVENEQNHIEELL